MPTNKQMNRQARPSKPPMRLSIGAWFAIATVVAAGIAVIVWQLNELPEADREKPFNIGFAKPSTVRERGFDNLQNSISRFFTGMRTSTKPIEDELSPYVIALETTPFPLSEVLAELANEKQQAGITPLASTWTGSLDEHWFMPDETLKGRLETLAIAEGLTFIWWLDRDYIVKSPFSVKGHFVDLVNEVAATINADYDTDVHGFLCVAQHAIIMIKKEFERLVEDDCLTLRDDESQPLDANPLDADELPNLRLKNNSPRS